MRFSERIKKVSASDIIQRDDMNQNLRNSLWNMFCFYLEMDPNNNFAYELQKWLYFRLYKLPVDEIRKSYSDYFLKKAILEDDWYIVYDLLEETVSYLNSGNHYTVMNKNDFLEFCNAIFQRENSAYRFVDDIITDITNEYEIQSIEDSINSPLGKAGIHIKEALILLSDREHPDYRNSIKESISAVEAVCRHITGESTLDRALPKLKNKGIAIPEMLEDGMKKLYNFTNGEAGIRHALMDETINIGFEEAKYMLVTCSAFVNYLKGKSIDKN